MAFTQSSKKSSEITDFSSSPPPNISTITKDENNVDDGKKDKNLSRESSATINSHQAIHLDRTSHALAETEEASNTPFDILRRPDFVSASDSFDRHPDSIHEEKNEISTENSESNGDPSVTCRSDNFDNQNFVTSMGRKKDQIQRTIKKYSSAPSNWDAGDLQISPEASKAVFALPVLCVPVEGHKKRKNNAQLEMSHDTTPSSAVQAKERTNNKIKKTLTIAGVRSKVLASPEGDDFGTELAEAPEPTTVTPYRQTTQVESDDVPPSLTRNLGFTPRHPGPGAYAVSYSNISSSSSNSNASVASLHSSIFVTTATVVDDVPLVDAEPMPAPPRKSCGCVVRIGRVHMQLTFALVIVAVIAIVVSTLARKSPEKLMSQDTSPENLGFPKQFLRRMSQ